MNLLTYI